MNRDKGCDSSYIARVESGKKECMSVVVALFEFHSRISSHKERREEEKDLKCLFQTS